MNQATLQSILGSKLLDEILHNHEIETPGNRNKVLNVAQSDKEQVAGKSLSFLEEVTKSSYFSAHPV